MSELNQIDSNIYKNKEVLKIISSTYNDVIDLFIKTYKEKNVINDSVDYLEMSRSLTNAFIHLQNHVNTRLGIITSLDLVLATSSQTNALEQLTHQYHSFAKLLNFKTFEATHILNQ